MTKENAITVTVSASFAMASIWNAQLPSVYEARQMEEDGDFRATQYSLLVFSVALAIVLGGVTNSTLPVVGILGMAFAQAAYYEWAIRA